MIQGIVSSKGLFGTALLTFSDHSASRRQRKSEELRCSIDGEWKKGGSWLLLRRPLVITRILCKRVYRSVVRLCTFFVAFVVSFVSSVCVRAVVKIYELGTVGTAMGSLVRCSISSTMV